ncbi:hypothetical protein PO909_014601 [Leuciscus waleckii]
MQPVLFIPRVLKSALKRICHSATMASSSSSRKTTSSTGRSMAGVGSGSVFEVGFGSGSRSLVGFGSGCRSLVGFGSWSMTFECEIMETRSKFCGPVRSGNKDITGPQLDPLQFAYRTNRSADDAVNIGLQYILHHLDSPGTYARILFVDFSSAFNTIIPEHLHQKLTQFSVPASTCQWITSFLSDRQQYVRLGSNSSKPRSIITGAPQGCVLSPLLVSLYTNDCTSKHTSVKLLKFADYTTIIGLIRDGDESAYRQEVEQLVQWCSQNHLELNPKKTVEMTVDFRRRGS